MLLGSDFIYLSCFVVVHIFGTFFVRNNNKNTLTTETIGNLSILIMYYNKYLQ